MNKGFEMNDNMTASERVDRIAYYAKLDSLLGQVVSLLDRTRRDFER